MKDTSKIKEMLNNEFKDVENTKPTINNLLTEDILEKLVLGIDKVDFKILAFPELPELIKEAEHLKNGLFEEDGTPINENDADLKRLKSLQKQISRYRLTKAHFLVLSIEQLNKIAKLHKWALCRKNGYIYLFNGFYWSTIEKELFQYFLGNVSLKMGVDKITAKVHTYKDDLFKQFLSDSYLPNPTETKDKVLINLKNGTYEIDGNQRTLRDFKQEDFITYQLPFEYNPQAKYPLFQKFLDEVLPDEGKQKVLAEYIGSLFIKRSVMKFEKMLVLYGTGANGKSIVFEIVSALLGMENVSNYSLQNLTDDSGYYRSKIANKLVNYSSEMSGKLQTDNFKKMASSEPIEARLPYGEPFELYDYAKLIFNCNALPRDVEHTNAFFRRFLILHFDVTIPEDKQDIDLASKIINNELSGIFNWVLEGLERVFKQRGFTKCASVDNVLKDYQKQSDSVKMFIDESDFKPSVSDYILINQLYPIYREFCRDDGFIPVNKTNFKKRLIHHKVLVDRISVGNVAYLTTKNISDDVEF